MEYVEAVFASFTRLLANAFCKRDIPHRSSLICRILVSICIEGERKCSDTEGTRENVHERETEEHRHRHATERETQTNKDSFTDFSLMVTLVPQLNINKSVLMGWLCGCTKLDKTHGHHDVQRNSDQINFDGLGGRMCSCVCSCISGDGDTCTLAAVSSNGDLFVWGISIENM